MEKNYKKDVLICCDHREEEIAKTLKEIIDNVFRDEIEVDLCISPPHKDKKKKYNDRTSPAKDEKNYGWQKKFLGNKIYRNVFIVCSPFAISRPWINFISGVATLYDDSCGENNCSNGQTDFTNRIIPLCHSGQKPNDLPHYLLTRQALDIEHERFVDAFISLLSNRDIELAEFAKKDFSNKEGELNTSKIVKLCSKIQSVLTGKEASGLENEFLKNKPDTNIEWLNRSLESSEFFTKFEVKYNIDKYDIDKEESEFQRLIEDNPDFAILIKDNPDFGVLTKDYKKHKRPNDLKELIRRYLEISHPGLVFKRPETEHDIRNKIDKAIEKICELDPVVDESYEKSSILFDFMHTKDGIASLTNRRTHIDPYPTIAQRLLKQKEIDALLKTRIDGIEASIGMQYCLSDGENIYIGVKAESESSKKFKSSVSMGVFDPGYKLIDDTISSIEVLPDPFKCISKHVEPQSQVFKLIKSHLFAAGKDICRFKFAGCDKRSFTATIFPNNSTPVPRIEIGIWKYIDISDAKDARMNANLELAFVADCSNNGSDQLIAYWIWVKNGEIKFWAFPKAECIPRYFTDDSLETENALFLETQDIHERYGRPEKYTPFAPDDLLGHENVIKGHFSPAARALLSVF